MNEEVASALAALNQTLKRLVDELHEINENLGPKEEAETDVPGL